MEILFHGTIGIGEIFQNMTNVTILGGPIIHLSQLAPGGVERDFHPPRISLY